MNDRKIYYCDEKDIFSNTCLIDGKVYYYNYARDVSEIPSPNFKYIGCGTIYEINGVKQCGKSKHHFFISIKKNELRINKINNNAIKEMNQINMCIK